MLIEIDHSAASTPSKAALQQLLSKELKEELEKIDIRTIYSGHGLAKAESKVFVWHEKKVKDLSKTAEKEQAKEEPKQEVKEVSKEEKKEKPKE